MSTKEKQQEREINKLDDHVFVESSIECSKCRITSATSGDSGAEEFYDEGWRGTDKNCYCPECAEKYLKRK